MKIIILIIVSYFLCQFIKPIWKALIFGLISYVIVSFIILIINAPATGKLNITTSSMSYFIGEALGEFLVNFIFGFAIFSIFNKSKKTEIELIENSNNEDMPDNFLNTSPNNEKD